MRGASVDVRPGLLWVWSAIFVCLLWSSIAVGYPAGPDVQQQTEGGSPQSFALSQGSRCVELTALGDGRRSISEQYDYRNPYTEPSSFRYGSFGTRAIQQSNTSQLFVYRGRNGYSLVFLHDSLDEDRGGGTISANVSGLPPDGQWVVEDDLYEGRDDVFSHEEGSSYIEWVWNQGNRTDGGAFRGLGSSEYEAITISMEFNEASPRYPFEKWSEPIDRNQITAWVARSGTGTAYQLDMDQSVRLRPGSCESAARRPPETATPTESPESTAQRTTAIPTESSTTAATEESRTPQQSSNTDPDPTLVPLRTTSARLTETIAPGTTTGATTAEQASRSTESPPASSRNSSQSPTVQRSTASSSPTTGPPPESSAATEQAIEPESTADRETTQASARSEASTGAESSRKEVLMYVLAGLVSGLMMAGVGLVYWSRDK